MADDYVSLEDYVEEVCKQILRGVIKAQGDENFGEYIGVRSLNNKSYDNSGNFVSEVTFDVTAQVNQSADGGGKIGVKVANAGVNLKKEQSAMNKISFVLPIAIPTPEKELQKRKACAEKFSNFEPQDFGAV